MKKELIRTIAASIMAMGFFAGIAFAQAGNTAPAQQRTYNRNMMGNGGMYQGGMMNGRRMNGGMMGGGYQNGYRGNMRSGGMMGGYHNGYRGGMWNGMGCNGMMGGAMMNRMTPATQQKFMDQTTNLRKQMMDLRFAYRNAMYNNNTTPEDLAKIEKQMLDVRTKMMDKMEKLQTK